MSAVTTSRWGALSSRDFDLYWGGVVLSQVGTRGTLAANLYQVYQLTGSLGLTGLVGASQAIAILTLGPLGGVYADRIDRRRLLQATQLLSMVVAAALAVLTFTGAVTTGAIVASVVLTTAASTFDGPARQALIPEMVPPEHLGQAFALLNPSREIAFLLGPALAGGLIALQGPGLMYACDAITYAMLAVILAVLRGGTQGPLHPGVTVREQVVEGVRFVSHHRIVWMLMSVDFAACLFGAYRVTLPAIADRLHVGAGGYGLLSAAPPAGALIVTYAIVRLVGRSRRLGWVILGSTIAYGAVVVLLGHAGTFVVALIAGLLLGASDAAAATIRQVVVQLETPNDLRGRVTAIYQMSSRGGPALGDTLIGSVAGAVGVAAALTGGGILAAALAVILVTRPNQVREYAGARAAPAETTAVG